VLDGYDYLMMHEFYKEYFRTRLLQGELPLWNPYTALGRPFAADAETTVFYPLNWLFLSAKPAALFIYVFIHNLILVGGCYRFGRALTGRKIVGLLLAVGFVWCGPVVARFQAGQLQVFCTIAWMPWLFVIAMDLQERISLRALLAFSLVLALAVLAGSPPFLFSIGCGLALFLSFRQEWRPLRNDPVSRLRLLQLAGAILLGLGLSSITLLPFIELVANGNRPLNAGTVAGMNGLPLGALSTLLIPARSGLAANQEYDLFTALPFLIFAPISLAIFKFRNIRALLLMTLLFGLLSAGSGTLIFRWWVECIPGASALRIPSRYALVSVFGLITLGAIGFTHCTSRPKIGIATVSATLAALLMMALTSANAEPSPVADGSFARLGAITGTMIVVLLLIWHREKTSARGISSAVLTGGLLLVCTQAEGTWAAWLRAPFHARTRPPAETEKQLDNFLKKSTLLRADRASPRVVMHPAAIRPNAALRYKWSTLDSFSNPGLARTWTFLFNEAELPVISEDLINVPQALSNALSHRRDAGLAIEVTTDFARSSVNMVKQPEPRAWLVHQWETVGDWPEALSRAHIERGLGHRALIEAKYAQSVHFSSSPASGQLPVPARITKFEPERLEIEFEPMSVPALLVLSESWYPGWKAMTNGNEIPVFPANGWMRAIAIPPYTHSVILTFLPRSLYWGAMISTISMLICVSLMYHTWRCNNLRASTLT